VVGETVDGYVGVVGRQVLYHVSNFKKILAGSGWSARQLIVGGDVIAEGIVRRARATAQ
jgi:hypothetical protein